MMIHSPAQAALSAQTARHGALSLDLQSATAFAHSLRVAGYRVDVSQVLDDILHNDSIWVEDAFGYGVSVRVPQVRAKPSLLQEGR